MMQEAGVDNGEWYAFFICKVRMALVSCLCYQSTITGLFLTHATLVVSVGHLRSRGRLWKRLCVELLSVFPVFLKCVLHARPGISAQPITFHLTAVM